MKKLPYIDLHTHSCLSDGNLTPTELLTAARDAGIGILALTDHNALADLAPYRAAFPELTLIQGAEITCRYGGIELHVVALGVDPENPKIKAVLAQNQPDRRPYLSAILDKLLQLGIDVGTYDALAAANPHSRHFGRMQIAKEMVNRGYVNSADEAFDIYMGAHGQKLAYVPNPLKYVSLEEAVDAILSAGGVPVLAHLYYYLMDAEGERALVRRFRELAGDRAAMEVEYAAYDRAQRDALRAMADEFGLHYSCASDFHGNLEGETLAHGFDPELCRPLLNLLGL
ncbi:MAG: PHP domain-containing protein [Oscillospiraceae bacterium]|nr:PHP domain-containing protein [Oscillospiraceae bacterium]